MTKKKYSSYKEIDQELAILKLEREINYKKIILNIDKTKEILLPSKPLSIIHMVYKNFIKGSFGTIIKIALPILVNWYLNKKRGD